MDGQTDLLSIVIKVELSLKLDVDGETNKYAILKDMNTSDHSCMFSVSLTNPFMFDSEV